MNIGSSLAGLVEVELTSAELPEVLAQINRLGIEICDLRWKNELTCVFCVRHKHYRILSKWTRKRGVTLEFHKPLGIFWLWKPLLSRPYVWSGILLFLLLSVSLPGRILFVCVEGNSSVPDSMILDAAEKQGVRFGASRRELRSERIKNGILSDIPQLQWIGVNTSGCVATVSVRESHIHKQGLEQSQISNIVAAQDGYILYGTAECGTAMFREGQAVQKGQLLISGYMNTDFCIRAVRAEGEIWAQTNRQLVTATPDTHLLRSREKGTKRVISILFRKKRINLWKDSGILPTTCGRMYEEYYIPLPGGFRLPAAICIDVYTIWDTSESAQSQEVAYNQLRLFSEQYLHANMIAGSVRNSTVRLAHEKGVFLLDGDYVCEEMIGREQAEQIGVTNGTNN